MKTTSRLPTGRLNATCSVCGFKILTSSTKHPGIIQTNQRCVLDFRGLHFIFTSRLKELGVNQLEDIYRLEGDLNNADFGSDSNNWSKVLKTLPPFQKDLQEFEVSLLKQLKPPKPKWITWGKHTIQILFEHK